MAIFSAISKERLGTCHPDLQKLFYAVVRDYDCVVLDGYRGRSDQERAFDMGRSKLHFPNSSHNSKPSLAIDVAPFPLDWRDKSRFYHFAGYVFGIANTMGITLRWGGDWDGHRDFTNNLFSDLDHFELVNKIGSNDSLNQVPAEDRSTS